jgi:hypothetical protein
LEAILGFRTNWLIVGIGPISTKTHKKRLFDAKHFLDLGLRLGLEIDLNTFSELQEFRSRTIIGWVLPS